MLTERQRIQKKAEDQKKKTQLVIKISLLLIGVAVIGIVLYSTITKGIENFSNVESGKAGSSSEVERGEDYGKPDGTEDPTRILDKTENGKPVGTDWTIPIQERLGVDLSLITFPIERTQTLDIPKLGRVLSDTEMIGAELEALKEEMDRRGDYSLLETPDGGLLMIRRFMNDDPRDKVEWDSMNRVYNVEKYEGELGYQKVFLADEGLSFYCPSFWGTLEFRLVSTDVDVTASDARAYDIYDEDGYILGRLGIYHCDYRGNYNKAFGDHGIEIWYDKGNTNMMYSYAQMTDEIQKFGGIPEDEKRPESGLALKEIIWDSLLLE